MNRAEATLKHIGTPDPKQNDFVMKLLRESDWPFQIRAMVSFAHNDEIFEGDPIEYIERMMDLFAYNAGLVFPELTDYCRCEVTQDFQAYMNHETSEYGIWHRCPSCTQAGFYGSDLEHKIYTKVILDDVGKKNVTSYRWAYEKPIKKRLPKN